MRKHLTTMTLWAGICLATFAFSPAARGGEHPTEHPEKAAEEEHPERAHKEHKADLETEFSGAVEDYAKKTLSGKGSLPVQDVHGKDVPLSGTLELKRIHKDRIVRYQGDTYFACSDFVQTEGKKKTDIDLDFFMTKTADGWKTDRILLHKVNGKPLLTYVNNKPVPSEEKAK